MKNHIIHILLFFVPGALATLIAACIPPTDLSEKKKPSKSIEINIPMPEYNANVSVASNTGNEKRRPAAGKANLQGKVLYNEMPVAGIEVRLCEKMSTVLGLECEGKMFKVRTDKNGEYLIPDVPPIEYEGVAARVYNSSAFIFLSSDTLNSAKYQLVPNETFFAPDINLFKYDLKIIDPQIHSDAAGDPLKLSWQTYPGAAHYSYSLYAQASDAPIDKYIDVRTDATGATLDGLQSGKYTLAVEALNERDVKLAQSPDDYSFYVRRKSSNVQ